MQNTIVILSPGPACWKSRKIILYLEEYLKAAPVEAKIEVIHKLREMLTYRTWILPTIVINNKVIARGYKPSKRKLDLAFGIAPMEIQ